MSPFINPFSLDPGTYLFLAAVRTLPGWKVSWSCDRWATYAGSRRPDAAVTNLVTRPFRDRHPGWSDSVNLEETIIFEPGLPLDAEPDATGCDLDLVLTVSLRGRS